MMRNNKNKQFGSCRKLLIYSGYPFHFPLTIKMERNLSANSVTFLPPSPSFPLKPFSRKYYMKVALKARNTVFTVAISRCHGNPLALI